MKYLFFLSVVIFGLTSCFDEDPSSRLNLNFDNTNYVIDASEDVTLSESGGLTILADSENFKLKISVGSYSSSQGTYANDEIDIDVSFEGVEYSMPATFKNFIVHNDTDELLSGQYDFRQPDNVTNEQFIAVGSFNILR